MDSKELIEEKIKVLLGATINLVVDNNLSSVNITVTKNSEMWVVNINKVNSNIMEDILNQRNSINILNRLN